MLPRKKFRFTYYIVSIFYLLLILSPNNTAYADLPDTGVMKCYDDYREVVCPSIEQPFYGQDRNYAGPQPAYLKSADGFLVTDLNTGLMWQQASDGLLRTWSAAVSYCEGLELGGHSNWRLPSCQELASIVDYGRYNLSINPVFSCEANWYWSSNRVIAQEASYWAVEFVNGYSAPHLTVSPSLVRCVRSGP